MKEESVKEALRTPRDLPDWKPGLRSELRVGGRYLLLDECGRGSAAIVYKARDTWSDQIVALKVLKGSSAAHPRMAAGFQREAEIGKRIQHPNVVTVYGSGVHEGWIFLAMEYLGGRTLAELMALSPRLPMDEFELLYRQLLNALDCIHSAGIVHRDLKPSNVMMTQQGGWKLMDFGISRFADAAPTVGPALGTPGYMSPEQMLGDPATAQSDLYAVGALFYEALAGQLPFRESGLVERCRTAAPRVSALRPGVPAWLDAMIARCLEINPQVRFASAAEALAQTGTFEEAILDIPLVPPPLPVELPRAPELPLLRDYLTNEPGNSNDVLAIFLEILRVLQRRALRGEAIDPITPLTVHRSPSGRIEIPGHGRRETRDTVVVESPKYAAPEILRGRSGPAPDARVRPDLYAVGFMLYEFLAGRDLFRREFPGLDDSGAGLAWMEWHVDPNKKATPIQQLAPGTPATASELVASMIEKDPSKRCATYEEAIAKLQSLLHRTQVTQELNLADLNLTGLTPVMPGTAGPSSNKSVSANQSASAMKSPVAISTPRRAKWPLVVVGLLLVAALAIAALLRFR